MVDCNRQEIQDDIFRMYRACIDSEDGKLRDAPIDIERLKKLLTGSKSSYKEIDFEMELNYLIGSKYFKRYTTHFIIPTIYGINKIWGDTINLPLGNEDNSNNKIENTNEILKLSPEFYGISINLKSLLKKIKNWIKHEN